MTDRMSQTEAVMWTVEKDPSLRSDFLNITILDQPPDFERLRAKVASALDALPRLRQRVVSAPLRIAPPEWADDRDFDLDYHVRKVAVPTPGSMRQLLDLAATLSLIPFDRARPLWDLTVIEGLEGGRAALLQKIHHTIIDGVGGVKFSLSLLDLERDTSASDDRAPDELPPDADHHRAGARRTPIDVLASAVGDTIQRQTGAARRAVTETERFLRHPGQFAETVGRFGDVVRSVREQVFVAGEALSPIMSGRSLGRRFDTHSIGLAEAKAVAGELGGTVNDFYVTGVAGAFGGYHERMGHPVEALRMAMPVNMREKDEGFSGNRFAPARTVVPVVPKDPAARFAAVRERIGGVRSEPAFDLVEPLAGLVSLLPTSFVVPVTRAQARTIDFVCSNVRGAPFDLFLAGARVEANFPMGPCTGAGANVTTLSYRDNLDIGINVDPAAVTDAESLRECIVESFDELLALVD